ncbi:hypothetical protein [Methylobacterium oryzae]|uniref:hypothetical protein n=1 Tax=Methylobacterium oryzae TaxID=334852 RepID=UPI001F39A2E6|nr:hypothetical protein [Methylobacterium oryzae]UIN36297.1 hypothetical protein LXM90_07295 [Methylobacterium oryzae]
MASQTFTSWKLDLLNAAGMDPALKPVSVRFLLRLVEALDEDTWDRAASVCTARIGDDVIAEEMPGLKDRQVIRDHRKALAAAGWLTFIPGSSRKGEARKATVYFLTDKPANSLLDRRTELREARKERRAAEDLERRAMSAQGGKRPLVSAPTGGQTSSREGDLYPPFHLRDSPSVSPPAVQDVALGFDPETGEIPLSPESEGGGTRVVPTCDECDQPAVIRCGVFEGAYCRKHGWLAKRPEPIEAHSVEQPQPAKPIDYRALSRGE